MPRNGHRPGRPRRRAPWPDVDGFRILERPEPSMACQAFQRKCLPPASSKPRARKSGSASTRATRFERWPWRPPPCAHGVALHEQLEHTMGERTASAASPADPEALDIAHTPTARHCSTCRRPTATSAVAGRYRPLGLSLTGSMSSFYPTGVTRARFPTYLLRHEDTCRRRLRSQRPVAGRGVRDQRPRPRGDARQDEFRRAVPLRRAHPNGRLHRAPSRWCAVTREPESSRRSATTCGLQAR